MKVKSSGDFQSFKTLIVATIIIVVLLNTTLLVQVPMAFSQSGLEGQTDSGLVAADGQTKPTTAICTLITGEMLQVMRSEDGRYTIAMISNTTAFQTINDGEDTYVIPAGAEQLIGDTLDMQLFNINYLIENGYCDAEMLTVPVIIEYSTNPGREHAKINTAPGLLKKQDYETVYASSADVTKEEADEFADATFYTEGGLEGVTKIWLDRKIKLSLGDSVPGIGAPYAWDQGYNGTGVKIAILDTGIWKDHPDLAGKVIAEKDFTDDLTTEDLYGHGTHCAGIAAANGALKGVAPSALLINAKALNQHGSGQMSWAMTAWEWAATQGANVFSMSFGTSPTDGTAPWDIELNTIVDTYNIVAVASTGNDYNYYTIASPGAADKVISVGATTKIGIPKLSVVSPEAKDIQANLLDYSSKPPVEGMEKPIVYAGLGCEAKDFEGVSGKIALIGRGICTFQIKVENAAKAGAVAAIIYNNVAGNFQGTLSALGMIPAVSISLENGNYLLGLLGKGEVIVNLGWDPKAVSMAAFSSRGPRLDYAVKPEIVAPGVAIKSTVPTYAGPLCDPSGYILLSGTSMATPHIAGAAALLVQKHPDWKPMQIRDALMSTAGIMPGYDIYTQGSGLVAVNKAIDANIVFEPAEISFGSIGKPWPVQSKSIAIRNYGDKEVTLELSVDSGIASLDKYTVTIPAGGIGTVRLSVNLTTAPTNTPLEGRIIAKNIETGEEIHAIFGMLKALGLNLKLKEIGPEGLPARGSIQVFDAYRYGGFRKSVTPNINGEAVVTIPPGTYNFLSYISRGGTYASWPNQWLYWMEALEVPIYEDKSVTLDAREAKPITFNKTIESTEPVYTESYIQWKYPNNSTRSWSYGTVWRLNVSAVPVGPAAIGTINMYNRFIEGNGKFYRKDLNLNHLYTTRIYDFLYAMAGKIETPIEYKVTNETLQEMAIVHEKHFALDKDTPFLNYTVPNSKMMAWILWSAPTEFYVPIVGAPGICYIQPVERNIYLTPEKWYQRALWTLHLNPVSGWPNIIWFEDWRTYTTGERTESTWLEQPMRPWTVEGLATRAGNKMYVRGAEFTDVNNYYPSHPEYGITFNMKVYKDDGLIWSLPDMYLWDQVVTPEEANYRIELYTKNVQATCPLNWMNYSTETFTTIKFKSKYVEGTENLLIINLDYKIPGLRINNVRVVSTKDPLNIHLIPQSLKGLSISQVRFWYSYDDGATWKEIGRVVKGTDEWIVWPEYHEGYISIKTLATDQLGNSIEQRIMRAFYVTTTPQHFWFD